MSHRRSAKRTRRILRHKLRALHASVLAQFPGRTIQTFLDTSECSDTEMFLGQWHKETHAWSTVLLTHGWDHICHGKVDGSAIVPYRGGWFPNV